MIAFSTVRSSHGSDFLLGELDLALELILELFWHLNLTVLGDGVFELTLDLHLHEGVLIFSFVWDLEDATIVLALEVSCPQATGLTHELILHVQVPVLVFGVELEVLTLRHIVDSHDSVILLQWVVLEGEHGVGDHLLEVMHLVDVFSLIPDTVWLVNEDQILVLGVHHLADVVPVSILKQDKDLHAVSCM